MGRDHDERDGRLASEIFQARVHGGLTGTLYHLRDSKGLEVDVVLEEGQRVVGVECKAGATVASGFTRNLEILCRLLASSDPPVESDLRLVYGGEEPQRRGEIRIVPWSELPSLGW